MTIKREDIEQLLHMAEIGARTSVRGEVTDDEALLARLRGPLLALPEAVEELRELESHHVERNGKVGRPEERSRTLRLVRSALARLTPKDPA